MAILFITGLSGTGKSTVLERLKVMGYPVVDTDYGYIKEDDGEVVLDEEKVTNLLKEHEDSHLFIAGVYSNQAKFYEYFDYVVLLKVDLDIMLERIKNRASNDYGKSQEEAEKVIASYESVLPLLEGGADVVIDASNTGVDTICTRLVELL